MPISSEGIRRVDGDVSFDVPARRNSGRAFEAALKRVRLILGGEKGGGANDRQRGQTECMTRSRKGVHA